MKHVSILIPKGCVSISNIESTYQILSHVNGIMADREKARLFDIHLAGFPMPTSEYNGRFFAKPDVLLSEVTRTDLIIIPSLIGSPVNNIAMNQELIAWIKKHYQKVLK